MKRGGLETAVLLSIFLYRQTLWLFPRRFAADFGQEMVDTFGELLRDAAAGGWLSMMGAALREDRGGLLLLLREHWSNLREKRGGDVMRVVDGPYNGFAKAQKDRGDGPGSWPAGVAAMLPLIWPAFGLLTPLLTWLLANVDMSASEAQANIYGSIIATSVALLFLGLLLLGWLRGFPRWSYAYLGLVFSLSLLLVGSSTPGLWLFGYNRGRELWGWWAWVPLAAVAVTAVLLLLLTKPIWHQFRLLANIWNDWTRLSFMFYSMLSLYMIIAYDEVHSPYETPTLALATIFLALGALAYVKAGQTLTRFAALLAGFCCAWILGTTFLAIYWQSAQEVWKLGPGPHWSETARAMTQVGLWILLILSAPALIGVLRRSADTLRSA